MEEHPIPQDVTGFQFKLIGSMTIKQFAYVALGWIAAVIIFYLPIFFLFKFPLILLFGIGGIVVAFLPIEGRPIDIMVSNFFKAVLSPNQFVYQKVGRQFSFTNLPTNKNLPVIQQRQAASLQAAQNKQQQLQTFLNAPHHQNQNPLDKKEEEYIKSLSQASLQPQIQQQQPQAQQPQPPQQTAPQPPADTAASLTQQEEQLTHELEQAKKADVNNPKVSLLERQVQALHFQRQQLEQQLKQLQEQLSSSQKAQQKAAQSIPKEQLKSAGLPHVSDTPNVIVGIVKDSRGNVLPGMLVEVKDKDGNPVRAFKTNQLGQFASATPLATGIYSIELEDPKKQHAFDVVQISASNQILLPIEIISRDAREALRKELFN